MSRIEPVPSNLITTLWATELTGAPLGELAYLSVHHPQGTSDAAKTRDTTSGSGFRSSGTEGCCPFTAIQLLTFKAHPREAFGSTTCTGHQRS